jgi:hypothetical protein
MQGWLEKKGGVRRNWLRRWFAMKATSSGKEVNAAYIPLMASLSL